MAPGWRGIGKWDMTGRAARDEPVGAVVGRILFWPGIPGMICMGQGKGPRMDAQRGKAAHAKPALFSLWKVRSGEKELKVKWGGDPWGGTSESARTPRREGRALRTLRGCAPKPSGEKSPEFLWRIEYYS